MPDDLGGLGWRIVLIFHVFLMFFFVFALLFVFRTIAATNAAKLFPAGLPPGPTQ
jgi:hypothetical protein